MLSTEQIAMQIRLSLLKYLPEIIRESVKPMEHIDGIKIIQVDGLNNTKTGGVAGENDGDGKISLSDQLVNSALRYRGQAPLIDSLLADIGLKGDNINGLTAVLKPEEN